MPEQAAVTRVHRPHVVRRGDVERVIEMQDGALDVHVGVLAGTHTAKDCLAAAGPSSSSRTVEACDPGEREVLDRAAVDLFQGAVAAAGVVAGVRRPGI